MSDELARLQEESFERGGTAVRSSFAPERRLNALQLSRFLDGHVFAVAATTHPNATAHAAMTSYLRVGTEFWLPTTAGAVRIRNVETHPWLSLVVTEGERDSHVVVTAEGPAAVVSLDDAPHGLLDRLQDKSWVACWLKLTPARVFSYASANVDI